MQIANFILAALGFIAIFPTVLLLPVGTVFVIIGIVKKDYTYLKKYLKFWGFSLIGMVGVLIAFGLINVLFN